MAQHDKIASNLKSLIAIDGPVAVGKSSAGSLLAKKLGYIFFDTGMMYRAFTCKVLKLGIPLGDENELCELASKTNFDFVPYEKGKLSFLVDGVDVSSELSRPEVEEKVSLVSKVAGVRQVMLLEQRRLAQRGRVVMAGRDIGTKVLPWAGLKIFLVASAEERATRRYRELLGRGELANCDIVLAELRRRDEIDSHRSVSPLKPADDAIIINTEGLSLEEVVDKIHALAVS